MKKLKFVFKDQSIILAAVILAAIMIFVGVKEWAGAATSSNPQAEISGSGAAILTPNGTSTNNTATTNLGAQPTSGENTKRCSYCKTRLFVGSSCYSYWGESSSPCTDSCKPDICNRRGWFDWSAVNKDDSTLLPVENVVDTTVPASQGFWARLWDIIMSWFGR